MERVKIGIIGGTFDPIHYGHLIIAEEARVRVGLAKVIFIPAGHPPHKLRRPYSPAHHRYRMVELAISSNPYFEVSPIEVNRPGPSYSVDTVAMLRKEMGSDSELYFIMGVDSLAGILTWHRPDELIKLCKIIAVNRPGYGVDIEALDSVIPGIKKQVIFIKAPEIGISSTEIQERVREGLPIRYLVPPEVERYIYEHNLYKDYRDEKS
ncbi:MAG: nicotinate-nucleotide adenylyltransferase [Anaerolineae bacterium]|nr:nicotinate-nucleotide adenylyltransferase [Anaerolineae bacterium]MDW8102232.1 nicotinate-nucleotide adenylyltransferase [Anaerolineae bacterium]